MFSETKLAIFVLHRCKKPLVPCAKKRARLPLTRGRAVVHRHYPLTIRLVRFPARLVHAHQGRVRGFRTGDVVRANVPNGAGSVHIGRAAVRESGAFNIGKAQHVNWKSCQFIQRADGYGFAVPASPVPLFDWTLHPRLPATLASGGF
jgi:hypothetical protein